MSTVTQGIAEDCWNGPGSCCLRIRCPQDTPAHRIAQTYLAEIMRHSADPDAFAGLMSCHLKRVLQGLRDSSGAEAELRFHAVLALREFSVQWHRVASPPPATLALPPPDERLYLPFAQALPEYGMFVLELIAGAMREPLVPVRVDF